MTSQENCQSSKYGSTWGILISAVLTAAIFMSAIYLSEELGDYVEDALLLSVRIIIPSIFPFLILTEPLSKYMRFDTISPLTRIFERIFKINSQAIPVFLCGILCGFPIGAKMAYERYLCGALSRDECERLMAFANNAGPSYIISAVGVSIRGSVKDGVLLYISMILSSIITGFIIGIKKSKSDLSLINIEQNYSFINSVKGAASVCINVCAFISTFGIFVGLIKKFLKNKILLSLTISLLEIGNASIHLASRSGLCPIFSLALTSFAISFSGLSVIFQTLSIQDKSTRINTKLFITRKLLQGIISAIITTLIFLVLQAF